MSDLQRNYIYKSYRDGVFLGVIPNVTSQFGYSQNINTASAALNITVGLTPDTSNQPVSDILDENGVAITDEFGETITTERVADLVGNDNEAALIRNNNNVQVYEVSAEYPSGLLLFNGYISTWTANYGGDENIEFTVLGYGTELDNYIVTSGDAIDQSWDITNDFVSLGTDKFDAHNAYIQKFTVASGTTRLAAIELLVSTVPYGFNHVGATIHMDVFNNLTDAENFASTPLLSKSTTLPSTVFPDTITHKVTFTTPVTVTSGETLYFRIYVDWDGNNVTYEDYVYIYARTPSDYPAGTFYNWNVVTWAAENTKIGFKTYASSGDTTSPYLNTDPADILRDIMDVYNAQGGVITYDGTSIDDTGLSIDYTFKLNTLLEGIKKCFDLSPGNWYWYVNPGNDTLYFKETSATADHTFFKGRHIDNLSVQATIETVKNKVYFTGGDTGGGQNLFLLITDPTSLAANNNRVGLVKLTDNRVTIQATGEAIAQNYLDQFGLEAYQTTMVLNRNTYNAHLLQIGHTVGFAGFGTFVDNLILQVVTRTVDPDNVTLTLGILPHRASSRVERIERDLSSVQTVDNPSTPS